MATLLSSIETQARRHLLEETAAFWTSAQIIAIVNKGIKDLWRDVVDLKQEHYLTVDATNVSLAANTATMTGVPAGVHKVYLIEPRDLSSTGNNVGLSFENRELKHDHFQSARSVADIDPRNNTIFYAVTGTGAPVAAPTIYVAPQVTSAVLLTLYYVPVLADLAAAGDIPIPGEADNALIAWTIAFARAKEREDRSPDPNWLAVYATEKAHLLQSLGLRDYSRPSFVDAMFESYW